MTNVARNPMTDARCVSASDVRFKVHASRFGLLLGVTLAAASLFAATETRSDIEAAQFPETWDVSKRTTYRVDVCTATFAELDTYDFSVLARFFNLDSLPIGFVFFVH